MTELDDHELLAEFARNESEAAFAALIARYVNLVYSAALRFTGNPHHAEEITQAVFIILARKAGSLRRGTVLSGWLYQTARLTAANFVKGEIRRQRREQEAYMQSTLSEPETAAWEQIAPLLDEAMGRLGETDRNAVVLRFFENKTAQEVAAKLKLNEAAAHKRVSRAVEKLRKFFTKRGVTLSATLIAGAVSANSVQAAPVGLALTISATAAKGAAIAATVTTLVKGTLKLMTYAKLKLAIGITAAILFAGGAATVALSQISSGDKLILNKVVAANRLWLLAPPDTVMKYNYVFHLYSNKAPGGDLQKPVRVTNPRTALPQERQGITYSSLLQRLARNPEQVRVQSAKEENGKIRLVLKILPAPGAKTTGVVGGKSYPIPPLGMEYGNGISTPFYGYFSTGGTNAELVLDAEKMVPLSSMVTIPYGTVEESFSDYTEVSPGHYVPLSVTVKTTGLPLNWEVAWKFKVHDGVWLFDESQYRGKKAAWTDQVVVN